MADRETRLLTPAEAGKVLGIHATTVRRHVQRGLLRAIDVGVKGYPRMRISQDELDAFIARREIPHPYESGDSREAASA